MEIIQLQFIYFFLLVAGLFYSIPKSIRWSFVLIASLVFVSFQSINALAILLAISVFNYFSIRSIINHQENPYWSNRMLLFAILVNLSILGLFKYINVFNRTQNWFLMEHGIDLQIPHLEFILPLGISYYIFQAIAMNIDANLGKIDKAPSLKETVFFLSYFPKISAGPIERFEQFTAQLHIPTELNYENIKQGGRLILWGFFKKIFISGHIQAFIGPVFLSEEVFGLELLFTAFLYAFQVYIDISAYTDIALGVSRLFGIHLTENFNKPFLANSVSDFWRRWHISLSSWVNDYVFKPLNLWLSIQIRLGKWAIYIALTISFIIMGLWHGASKTFLAFGLVHGLFLSIEAATSSTRRTLFSNSSKHVLNFSGWLYAQTIFIFSCLLFKANSLSEFTHWIQSMVINTTTPSYILSNLSFKSVALLIGLLLFLIVDHKLPNNSISEWLEGKPWLLRWTFYGTVLYSIIALSDVGIQKFIYSAF